MSLDLVQSLVKFDALREPLVLEAVEGVEQTLVDKVDGRAQDFDRKKCEDFALDQEDYLHHDREDRIRNHDGDGEIDQRSPLR